MKAKAFGLLLALMAVVPELGALAADWRSTESSDEVTAVTRDQDGGVRETTIWIVTVASEVYVRTSGTPWESNIKRDPRFVLRIADEDYAVDSQRVRDDALVQEVQAQFRQKYGSADLLARAVRIIVGGGSHIYHVQLMDEAVPNTHLRR